MNNNEKDLVLIRYTLLIDTNYIIRVSNGVRMCGVEFLPFSDVFLMFILWFVVVNIEQWFDGKEMRRDECKALSNLIVSKVSKKRQQHNPHNVWSHRMVFIRESNNTHRKMTTTIHYKYFLVIEMRSNESQIIAYFRTLFGNRSEIFIFIILVTWITGYVTCVSLRELKERAQSQ